MKKYNGHSNYIVSSGLKVFIDNLPISNKFKEIYGTTLKYDNKGNAVDVDYILSDKNKVDVIKEIQRVNNQNDCSNIIFIGDGLTDYYAMEYVKNNGGISIFVYHDDNDKQMDKVRETGVVSEFFKADFSKNGKLYNYILEAIQI